MGPLVHWLRPARPESARVHERRLPGVGVVQELDVGTTGVGVNRNSFFYRNTETEIRP